MDQHPSYKKPLTLALTLAALSSLVYWFEFKKKPDDEVTENLQKRVFALNDPSIRRIILHKAATPDSTHVVLECALPKGECHSTNNTQWMLIEPLRTKADSANAQSLLTNVLTLGGGDAVDLKSESAERRAELLKSYRLDEASRKLASTVTLETDDGKTLTAYIGEDAATAASQYVLAAEAGRANETQVFLAAKHQTAALDQPISHWRDKRLVTIAQNEIHAFTLQSGGTAPAIEVAKTNGVWDVKVNAETLPADSDALNTFLSGVVYLNARNFHDEKKDSPSAVKFLAGLKPESVVELRSEKSKQTVRLFSKNFRDGEKTATIAYATVDDLDPVFEVETTAIDRLKLKPTDLRQKKLLPVSARGEIRFIRFQSTAGAKKFETKVSLSGAEWKREGAGTPVVDANINRILDQLSGPIIREFLPDQIPPPTALRMELGPNEADLRFKFAFWKLGRAVFAKNTDGTHKEVFHLDDEAAAVIPFEESGLTVARKDPPRPKDLESEDPNDFSDEHGDHDGHDHE